MSERGSEQKPTRKERRVAQRATAKQSSRPKQDFDLSRRKFLQDAVTVILPGGWIPDARKKGLTQLSTSAKISLAKDVVLSGGLTTLIGSELTKDKALKERIEAFTWEDANDPEKLRIFTQQMADAYLKLTNSTRVNKESLVGKDRTSYYPNRAAFTQAIKQIRPNFEPTVNQWGHTDYASGKVFLDLESLMSQALQIGSEAGPALVDALWHEWGHTDATERTTGEFINNSINPRTRISINNGYELFQKYRGGEIYGNTRSIFHRFEEVWNETNTARMIAEQVGLTEITSSADYYQNGVDVFFDLTRAAKIPLETSYQMHAASDLEGFAILVGSNLPGPNDPLYKGMELFNGIDQNREDWIEQTGVFTRIPRP